MRKLMLMMFVLGLAGMLWAADPEVGTWKVNLAKSKFPPGPAAATKVETNVIREVGDQIENITTGTRVDGSSISEKYIVYKKGGIVKYQQGGPGEGKSIVFTKIDAYVACFTTLQNGKQIEVGHYVISKDGKTMQGTIRGTDASGKPYEVQVWLDKQ